MWFLAIDLVREAKTGLSALALKRHWGVSYPTAWLLHHKLMQAMSERDALYTLRGTVQVDDAYLGGGVRRDAVLKTKYRSWRRCRWSTQTPRPSSGAPPFPALP